MSQSQLLVSCRALIDQRSDTELLGESPELSKRRGSFVQVNKVRLDSSFREESHGLSRVCTFFHAEDLYFHCHSRVEPANLNARAAHNQWNRVT